MAKKINKNAKKPKTKSQSGSKHPDNHNSIKKKKQDSKTSKDILWITISIIIIIGLILLSKPVFEYFTQKKILKEYNGFVFGKVDGMWKTHIQKSGTPRLYEISLHYAPWEVVEFPVYGNPIKFFELIEINDLNAVYFTFNLPSNQNNYLALAGAEMGMNLGTVLNITSVPACTKNITEECKTRPIVDCTKKNAFVIEFREEPEKSKQGVFADKNCMIIKADEMNFLQAVDKILYMIYRIPIESL